MTKMLITIMSVIAMAPSAYASGIVGMQEIGPDVCQRDYLGLDGKVVTSLIYCSTGESYVETTNNTSCWSSDAVPYIRSRI